MEMFVVDEDVARWEQSLPALHGAERLHALLPLAWHLRQRDTVRALALAREALDLLPGAALPAPERALAEVRMALVFAESCWLNGALNEALARAGAILATCTDPLARADAYWLLAAIALDRGDHGDVEQQFGLAAEAARDGGDELRARLAEAALARSLLLKDRDAALARWGDRMNASGAAGHPALTAWISDFQAVAANLAADFSVSATCFMRSHEAALQSGQLRSAINAASNIGENFTMLGDHQTALEWHQNALALARPTVWPKTVSGCLMQSANTLRRLGQLAAAQDMLDQALATLKPVENTRSYAIALQYQGELSLDRDDFHAALATFQALEARAEMLGQSDFQSTAKRGQAHALLRLGRADEALEAAASAMTLAAERTLAHSRIDALRVMAMIHASHSLPAPRGMVEPTASLHYLREALEAGAGIDQYCAPAGLHDTMAREYAAAGDFARAYESALAAGAAREKTHGQETTNRAIAMQVQHQTAQARSEGQHHRELARVEALRARQLQRTSETLARLSAIGQEITSQLDARAVFDVLAGHTGALLGASTLTVYLTDESGSHLQRAFGAEPGCPLPPSSIPLSNEQAVSVRCLGERREIYIPHWPDADQRMVARDDRLCALFVPLVVGERAIGVMAAQAPHSHAYGEEERLVFRTLCAYGAIALDNAAAYRQLKDAQSQLASQQKLAALGSLMAGVAHELNTPIGNSLLIASTMQAKTEDMEALLNGRGLRRSDLAAYLAETKTASVLVLRGLASAAELVNSFKQVAVDRTTEQRRQFNLLQVCRESVATMMNRIRGAGHEIELRIGEQIVLDSYPGPFGQVVTNFINNALVHAFGGKRGGRMVLSAETRVAGRVLFEFRDDGVGIPPEHLNRIFDPFFTTRLGQGGSGLGLSISYNIVTVLLGGQVAVSSGAAGGACFTLDLPLVAPRPKPGAHDQDDPSI
ncbi:ATP-binding protein [Massilia sp. R2A-15]|uniref:ATP-binding protein n=1 Tax=Massilia sp. R2A-15 TaxID=3064278 RepID=UPI00273274D1|nr:ATP-binding protein [Massilia sp. R2A-15]WLI90331.1 ATP-binding protein [Massilia sp. R2A-15]